MLLMIALVSALQAPSEPGPPTNEQFAAAREALDASMLDYPSARFRDVQADSRRICGFVNGKNRLAAFSGWQRFVAYNVRPSRVIVQEEDSLDEIGIVCDGPDAPAARRDYSDRLVHR